MAYCLRSHSVWRASAPYGQSFGFNFYAPCLRLVHGWAAGWKWYKTNLSLAGNKDETGKLPRFSNGFQKWTADQKKRAKTRKTATMAPAHKKPRAAGYITKTSSIVCMSKSKMAKNYKTTGKAHFVDVTPSESSTDYTWGVTTQPENLNKKKNQVINLDLYLFMSLAGGHSGLFSFDRQPRNDKVTKICITINNCKQAVNEVKFANIITEWSWQTS